jgi:hypothetical protein
MTSRQPDGEAEAAVFDRATFRFQSSGPGVDAPAGAQP